MGESDVNTIADNVPQGELLAGLSQKFNFKFSIFIFQPMKEYEDIVEIYDRLNVCV
jgi:hypothetical protein